MKFRTIVLGAAGVVGLLGVTACSSLKITNSSSGPPAVSVAMGVPDSSAVASISGASGDVAASPAPLRAVISTKRGDTTLTVTSVQMVLRELELRRSSATTPCTETPPGGTDSDPCDEILVGPALYALPLQTPGSSSRVALGFAKQETYSAFWFRLHRLSSSDSTDAAIISQYPYLNGASLYIKGTFNGQPFQVGLALDQTEKLSFQSPPSLQDGSQLAIGVTVDVLAWFVDPDTHQLIDPSTLPTDSNAQAKVAANIAGSLSMMITQL